MAWRWRETLYNSLAEARGSNPTPNSMSGNVHIHTAADTLRRRQSWIFAGTARNSWARKMASRRDKHRYKRVSYDGASYICKPDEVEDLIDSDGATTYEISDVWMTDDEYEQLPEFEGF